MPHLFTARAIRRATKSVPNAEVMIPPSRKKKEAERISRPARYLTS